MTVAGDQVACDLEGDIAILNLASGTYHGLDRVGAMVWHLLATPIAVSRLVDAVLERYDVARPRCEGDLLALLAKLADRGLIEVRDGRVG